jgi:hypothetical protein
VQHLPDLVRYAINALLLYGLQVLPLAPARSGPGGDAAKSLSRRARVLSAFAQQNKTMEKNYLNNNSYRRR